MNNTQSSFVYRVGFRIIHWVRRIPRRLAAIPESPHDIAKAFAIGVFIGVMPGMGAVVALLVAVLFRMSKTATLVGAMTNNPWTTVFIYGYSYKVGKWITRLDTTIQWHRIFTFQTEWLREVARAAPSVIVGTVVVGLASSFVSYFAVRALVTGYRESRLRRLEKRKARLRMTEWTSLEKSR